ncbi:MAG: phosphatase PAP2 family protein [Pyrinomonadaceae bacterium]
MEDEVPKQPGEPAAAPEPEPQGDDAPPASPQRRRETRRLMRAEVYYSAGLAAFAVLAVLANVYAYFDWDLRLARFIQSADSPAWSEFMRLASRFGDSWRPHALAGLTGLLFLLRRRRTECFALALSAGGGALLGRGFKMLIGRPRPTAELVGLSYRTDDMSFPSGHVVFYVCYFGFMFFAAYALLPRKTLRRRVALVVTALPVLFIGLSRVSLRAHWPSDVLGAYLLSGVWLGICVDLYRRWKRRATFHTEEEVKVEEAGDETNAG